MKFGSVEERAQALVAAAAIVMHADIACMGLAGSKDYQADRIRNAFDLGEQFLAEAERRVEAILQGKP